MRIDKWLWCVRLFKTRSQATDACKGGKIRLNGVLPKPSKEVKPGDKITFSKGIILYQVQVKELLKSRVGAKLVEDYLTDLTPKEEYEKAQKQRMMNQAVRDRGSGRPTKKDRRDLDSWDLWDD